MTFIKHWSYTVQAAVERLNANSRSKGNTGISVLPRQRQDLVPELCRNVKSHMRELRYEVLPRKHRFNITYRRGGGKKRKCNVKWIAITHFCRYDDDIITLVLKMNKDDVNW
jgi:hypothetical protein